MACIDLNIIVCKIKNYLNSKPVQQRLRLFHPKKVVAIKLEVEKILHVGFIYLVTLTNWYRT